ncbi:hypothetical protein HUA74_13605 [Myxococcus sp. CA051A]|uniref:Uncharacterized protein n=2 Tax=Myxococcus TaxID=32 RepID=A0A540WTU5_9BACT|nr:MULTISPECIES: hypothetical protein [Myxococcus]NTX36315.1 hypothetical protein [Myxococcus sp. CA033]NTX04159.1 hypothetical protein [Myxococcus sp. CA040A]NTX54462.1 hypothetical protein [Myxococcus sp. CA039A]NTX61693.1 hypothetical protein [Myxococcus sp. CA051A]TQF12445.1 hypothetical protein FJV41_29105 [Myxococcus llanfairpwllgwyngyllgogerychwyrndrobwllllantysiliogogogochensis]
MLVREMSTKADGGLYFELYWGENLADAWSYGPEQAKVHAAPDEKAPLPLYGFTLPEEPFLMAERTGRGWRIHLPPNVHVEHKARGDAFTSVPANQLVKDQGRTSVALADGMTLRLTEGQLSLLVQGSVVKERVGPLQWKDMGWLLIVGLLFLSLPVGFLLAGPTPQRAAESNARALQLAADKEAARRKQMGLDTPMRPITDAERSQQQTDGGPEEVHIPATFRSR